MMVLIPLLLSDSVTDIAFDPCASVQVASALEKLLRAPALLLPMGQASDACHLANERLRCQNLLHGKNVIKSFIQELAGYLPTGL